MKTLLVVSAFVLTSAAPGWLPAHAQESVRALMNHEAAAQRHVDGLSLEHRGEHKAALIAFLDAAEHGYSPAQRRLGEIYDNGNPAVKRDYEESIRWYQKAREAGEQIPAQKSPMPVILNTQ